MIPQRSPYRGSQTPQGPMMLVSSSGWAHSPITLILIGLSIEFAVGGAALPGIATVIAIAAAVSTAPMNVARRCLIDRTSGPPPENDGNKWGSATDTAVRMKPVCRTTVVQLRARPAPNRARSNTQGRPTL